MTKPLITLGLALLFTTSAIATDITAVAKDGICRISLARINHNEPTEYKNKGAFEDTTQYASAKGYTYYCEVFSDGMVFTLSSPSWGRLKPTGSVTPAGRCSNIKLFDPAFGITHSLKSCSK